MKIEWKKLEYKWREEHGRLSLIASIELSLFFLSCFNEINLTSSESI